MNDCDPNKKPSICPHPPLVSFQAHYLLPMLCALWLSPLQVQAADIETPRQLEEIIVTAQKRVESLQDVPISMSVVGSEEISELAVFDFSEIAALTPGVNIVGGAQSAAIRVRGVGPGNFGLTNPQSVAVFVDQYSQAAVGAVFSTLVDVERIELLRGPQGTLYGQNAPSGAFNITTRAPTTEQVEGYIEGTYGQHDSASLESVDLRGAINLPLVEEVLAVRLAGVYTDSDGFIKVKNPVSGEDSTGGNEHTALRMRMLWQINADMDLSAIVNYQDLDDQGEASNANVEGIVPRTGGTSSIPAITSKFEDRDFYGDFISKSETDIKDVSLHWRWAPDAVNIDFLAFYQDFDTYQNTNNDPFPGGTAAFELRLDWETSSAELRFSDVGESFDYIAGLYYSSREFVGDFNLGFPGAAVTGPGNGGVDSYAAFANITFHLADEWDFSTGLRYDINDTYTESNFDLAGAPAIAEGDESFDHWSWSLKLRHYFSEQTTGYIAVDHAYKYGGFNNLVPAVIPFAPIFPEIVEVAEAMLAYDEETSTAFEIGLKGSALDARLSYNIALFYQEFKDHQLTQPIGVTALQTAVGDLNGVFLNQLVNAEDVVTAGIEFDVFYLLGEYWDVSLRAAYADATIEEWSLRLCPGGEEESPGQLICPGSSGEQLNGNPQYNTNFQLGNTQPISDNWDFYSRINWTWRSKPNITNDIAKYNGSRSFLGLTVGLRSPSSGLDIRVWGKNLTNVNRPTNPSRQFDGVSSQPTAYLGAFSPTREYGLTANYTF